MEKNTDYESRTLAGDSVIECVYDDAMNKLITCIADAVCRVSDAYSCDTVTAALIVFAAVEAGKVDDAAGAADAVQVSF